MSREGLVSNGPPERYNMLTRRVDPTPTCPESPIPLPSSARARAEVLSPNIVGVSFGKYDPIIMAGVYLRP